METTTGFPPRGLHPGTCLTAISEHPNNQRHRQHCSQNSSCVPKSHERWGRFPSQGPLRCTHAFLSPGSPLALVAQPALLSKQFKRENARIRNGTAHLCTICHRFNVLSNQPPGSTALVVPEHYYLLREHCWNGSLLMRVTSQGKAALYVRKTITSLEPKVERKKGWVRSFPQAGKYPLESYFQRFRIECGTCQVK